MNNFRRSSKQSGYTLVELIVAVGLFALIMTLVSGAYIIMISLTERAQSSATGIDNLSFALETMTRTIRTSTQYSCDEVGDCFGGASFSVVALNGDTITYTTTNNAITQTVTRGGVTIQDRIPLTDPSVTIPSDGLKFYVSGTPAGDNYQPYVSIIVHGTVSAGVDRPSQSFNVETGATMRVSDI